MAVYLVGREGATEEEKPRIVEARTAASAIAHVAKKTFAAQVISTKVAMTYAAQGIELETAGGDAE